MLKGFLQSMGLGLVAPSSLPRSSIRSCTVLHIAGFTTLVGHRTRSF